MTNYFPRRLGKSHRHPVYSGTLVGPINNCIRQLCKKLDRPEAYAAFAEVGLLCVAWLVTYWGGFLYACLYVYIKTRHPTSTPSGFFTHPSHRSAQVALIVVDTEKVLTKEQLGYLEHLLIIVKRGLGRCGSINKQQGSCAHGARGNGEKGGRVLSMLPSSLFFAVAHTCILVLACLCIHTLPGGVGYVPFPEDMPYQLQMEEHPLRDLALGRMLVPRVVDALGLPATDV